MTADILLASAHDAVDAVGGVSPDHGDFVSALAEHGTAALERGGPPSHLTASLFLFDDDGSHILLCLHGKGRFWVQPGGHLEAGDTSIAGAALRELAEETGIPSELVDDLRVVDLDHHALSARFGRCASHLDVGLAGTTSRGDSVLQISDESDDLRWWPLAALPSPLPHGFADRLARVRTAYARER